MIEPLWTPRAERVADTAMARFCARVGVPDRAALHRWSVSQPEAFWAAAWDELGMVGDRGDRVLDPGGSLPEARFFPDARLSVVEHLLGATGEGAAVISVAEDGTRHTLSWDGLRVEAGAMAAALADVGVGPGDRVAAWLPNDHHAIVAMLGAASLGATFSSTSPDFGAAGVLDRFGQIEPTVLFACPGYTYGGRWFDVSDRLPEIEAGLPTVRRVVVTGDDWEDFVGPHRGADVPLTRFPFDQPWYVLYSSGTTGKPKCIVHRTGGVLLQHLKEHRLHCDLRPGDRMLYVTTCGWMMWNWLVSALASQVTIVCFDGNVMHPGPETLWALADDLDVTLFGASARYLDAVANAGYRPIDRHDLSSVRTVGSTGSPLSPERAAWVYDAVAPDAHLVSFSGGTDLCGCFVGGDPTAPVWAGEIQAPMLGMATDVDDGAGGSLAARPGERGELVCRAPFPSQPLGFWGDDDGSRYRAAYFDAIPGVWHHGDFASWTERGGMVIHGRSDTTLNPGGVRIGTAEIYRQVELLPEVAESLVFGRDVTAADGSPDVEITLLVLLADGVGLDDDLAGRIRSGVREACSPRHVPRRIEAVADLPRTRSGKLVELAVADAVNGRDVRNTEAIANPDALWAIAARFG